MHLLPVKLGEALSQLHKRGFHTGVVGQGQQGVAVTHRRHWTQARLPALLVPWDKRQRGLQPTTMRTLHIRCKKGHLKDYRVEYPKGWSTLHRWKNLQYFALMCIFFGVDWSGINGNVGLCYSACSDWLGYQDSFCRQDLLLFLFLFHTMLTYKYALKASSVSDSLDLWKQGLLVEWRRQRVGAEWFSHDSLLSGLNSSIIWQPEGGCHQGVRANFSAVQTETEWEVDALTSRCFCGGRIPAHCPWLWGRRRGIDCALGQLGLAGGLYWRHRWTSDPV